jgi:hypothetical protein
VFIIDDAILAAILKVVAGEFAQRGLTLLQGNPEKRAFKDALREAAREFERFHPGWTETLFKKQFISGPAAPILAQALMRDTEPTAEALADAYAWFFYRDQSNRSEIASQVVPLAADFLIRFDMALRKQNAFREYFDSRALDASARYLYDLLQAAGQGWARDRANLVTEALEMLAGAAVRYREAGISRRDGETVTSETLIQAEEGIAMAFLRLDRMPYGDVARISEALRALVRERFEAVRYAAADAALDQAVDALIEGVKEFHKLLGMAAPI